MHLIEKLGGYEKAKQKYSERPFDLAWSDIGQALLDYRRQHNIFEEGDKVLFINDVYANYDNVVSIDFIGKFDLMVSDHTKGFQLNEFCGWSKIIRHATPEEIKAGRRL